jgi:hypothetical protein
MLHAMWRLAAIATLVTPTLASRSWEDIISEATLKVHREVDPSFEPIEVLACHHNPLAHEENCLRQGPAMKRLEDARYMRIVYFLPRMTRPNVEATVNLTTTPLDIRLHVHKRPFMEDDHTDGFPPPAGETFETAIQKVYQALGEVTYLSVSWRRPVHPCTSEDLFQFALANGDILSVGASSGKACVGFITNTVDLPMCDEPVCVDLGRSTNMTAQAAISV